ncbi:phosphopantetheine-binding protein [Rhizobiaceae bacterium n13]|uniref:Phosphopantetheine-binding protein n=1 Tax=Ferirhizobium litorale TaxID=2927786 RepID=A0AAE3Q807_9HYPH|nr:phosphopantetheine-binding protein [Fererhizobium litorale]MDI7860734.1 phosphopantetheine-binding protein [Fererhizobium litorale]MDI7920882.1 phosphopantetheine-binding protein [Fererhizobium litorale]
MNTSTLEAVKDVIIETLGIEDRGRIEGASTPLFGNIPELDSFAVLSLAAALESRFRFQIDDSDFTGEVFETVGSLAQFVDRNRTH